MVGTFNESRTGLASPIHSGGTRVVQRRNAAPVLLNPDLPKKITTTANVISSAESVQPVSIKKKSLTDTQDESIAEEVVKKLEETGLTIVKVLTMSLSNVDEPHIYYEVVSRAGDTFLIYYQRATSSLVTYIPGQANRTDKELIVAEGQVHPTKIRTSGSCVNDLVCSKVFTCDSESNICTGTTQNNFSTQFKKFYTPEGSSGDTRMTYGDNPLAFPVVSYNRYISNPKKVTTEVALETAKIHTEAFSSNQIIVENARLVMDECNRSADSLMKSFTEVQKTIAEQTKIADTLLDAYFDNAGPLSDKQHNNFKILLSRKISFNKLVSNLVKMVGKFSEDMEHINTTQHQFIVSNVKLWAQRALKLDKTASTAGELWSLPPQVTALGMVELENIFAGDNETLNKVVNTFITANGEALKTLNTALNERKAPLLTVEELRDLVQHRNSEDPLVLSVDGKSTPALTKLWFQVVAIDELYKLVDAVRPTLKIKLDKNLNQGVCKDGKICLNYDGKFTAKAGGNLPNLGEYKESDVTSGEQLLMSRDTLNHAIGGMIDSA